MADRRLLALLLAAGIAAAVLVAAAVSGGGGSRASDDRGPEGTAALAGVLRRLGHEPVSLRLGLHPLLGKPAGSVLMMPTSPGLLPAAPLGDAEVARLRSFVEAGSTVVVATHYPDPVTDAFGYAYDWTALDRLEAGERPRWRRALPVLPTSLSLGGPLAVEGRGGLSDRRGDEVLYAVGEVPVAVRRAVGDGWLVVVSDPTTLTNTGLGREGNLAFWVAVVEQHLKPGGELLWDDLHAGGGDEHGVVAYARRAGLLPTLLLAALLIGLFLWRSSIRLGGVLPPPDLRVSRASSELVTAVAGLYERADLHGHALAVVSRRFRRRLERRAGRKWATGDLPTWVEQELGPSARREFDHIRRLFARLLPQGDPDPDAVLDAARLVHRFEDEHLSSRRAIRRDR